MAPEFVGILPNDATCAELEHECLCGTEINYENLLCVKSSLKCISILNIYMIQVFGYESVRGLCNMYSDMITGINHQRQ